mgnify:FL=1
MTITKEIEGDLIRRALAAFYGSGGIAPPESAREPVAGRLATKPGRATAINPEPRPMNFIVLHAGVHILAVYKVRQVNDYLMLRRMVRPPKDLVRLKGSLALDSENRLTSALTSFDN